MEFKEQTPGEGTRSWLSECGNYKVTWRNQVCGCRVKQGCYALVKTIANRDTGKQMWDFAGRFGLYNSVKTAKLACAKHERLWHKVLKVAGTDRKGRLDRLDQLREVGWDRRQNGAPRVTAKRLMRSLPVWAAESSEPKLTKRIFISRSRKANNDDDD